MIVTDVGGHVTRVNRAAVEAFGPETAAVGRPIADLGGGELSDLVREAIASGRPAAEDASAGVQRLTTTGGAREYRLRTTPLRGGGDAVEGSVTLLEDVTHLREIDRVKSEFIAVASHELRTPLTSLTMALPLLLEPDAGPLTDRQRQLLELCRHHAERLQRLMRALLDVGRLEAGREEPVLAEVRACRQAWTAWSRPWPARPPGGPWRCAAKSRLACRRSWPIAARSNGCSPISSTTRCGRLRQAARCL